jgi:hypothetical protein
MDYTKIPDGASVFARKVCEEKAALYARYKELQEELDCATDRYEHFLAECTALHAENERLRGELEEAKQYNDLFRRCTRRALLLWREKHPDSKIWPDTAKNLCWLAEKNERLRVIVERILRIVPYVTATLRPVLQAKREGEDWGKAHTGRAYSSINQLEGLEKQARAALEGEE